MKITVGAVVQEIDMHGQARDASVLRAVLGVQESDFSDPVDGPALLHQLAVELRAFGSTRSIQDSGQAEAASARLNR